MAFRLTTIFWAIALTATALATFGVAGLLVAIFVLGTWRIVFYHGHKLVRFVAMLIVLQIVGDVLALLIPAIQESRWRGMQLPGLSAASSCRNNLKQLSLAILNYHDQYGEFPPRYVADANGTPMHSWRVLILPFLERKDLFDQYDLNEPWNGPNNSKLAASIVDVFRCPSQSDGSSDTNYFAIVGPKSAWPPEGGRKLRDFQDGTSRTLLLIEASGKGIHWMEPRDLTMEEAIEELKSPARTGHADPNAGMFTSRGPMRAVALCDGSVQTTAQLLDDAYANALITIAGREVMMWEYYEVYDDTDEKPVAVEPQILWGRVYSFTAFVVLALAPAWNWWRRAGARPRGADTENAIKDENASAKPVDA